MIMGNLIDLVFSKNDTILLNFLDKELVNTAKNITYISPSKTSNKSLELLQDINGSFKNALSPLITCCIITKNEERTIQRCIHSIYNEVDEVLVIDTGSTDNTIGIINDNFNGIKIIEKEWNNDFSEIRNYGLMLSQNNWVFFLDADEYLAHEDINKLKNIIKLVDMISDKCYYLSPTIIDHNGNKYLNTKRILNKKFNFRYIGRVHEEPKSIEYLEEFDIGLALTIYHDGYEKEVKSSKKKIERNLKLIKLMLKEEPDNPKWHYFYARSLLNDEREINRIEAEKKLLFVINNNMNNEYIPRSLILLCQIYLMRADLVNLKKYITLIKETKKNISNVDLLYLEMALSLMVFLNKMFIIRNKAEEYIEITDNSLINSRNEHLKHMVCLYSFHIGDFERISSYFNENEDFDEAESMIGNIDSCVKILNMMRNKFIQIQ